MTTETALPSIRSYEERAVLSKYALGSDLHDITDPRGHDWVAGVVMRVAGMDRGRARAAVLAYDSRMSTQGGRKEREAAAPVGTKVVKAKPARVSAAAKRAAEKPIAAPVKAPPPAAAAEPATPPAEPTAPRALVMPDDIEALLKEAEQSGLARLVEKAGRIRQHIHDLNAAMATSEKERVLRATIRVLTDQRLKAIEELKEITGKGEARVSDVPLTAEQRAEIRRWAAEKGMTVAGNGRIQQAVIDAWREANRQ